MQKYLHIIKSIETLKNKTIGYLKDVSLKNVKRRTMNSQTNGLEAAQVGLSAGERKIFSQSHMSNQDAEI